VQTRTVDCPNLRTGLVVRDGPLYYPAMDTSGKTGLGRVAQAGQGLVEYALILSLVAVLAIGATLFLGGQVSTVLSHTGAVLGDSSTGTGDSPGNYADEVACEKAGYDWHDNSCRDDPNRYTDYAACFAAGFYWYGQDSGECHRSQPDSSSSYHEQTWCETAGKYWHIDHCQSTGPSPTPTPTPTPNPTPTPTPTPTINWSAQSGINCVGGPNVSASCGGGQGDYTNLSYAWNNGNRVWTLTFAGGITWTCNQHDTNPSGNTYHVRCTGP
jgi:Flp pilus assembly pilin Flp/type II secretory pathway pseudopilin PulG